MLRTIKGFYIKEQPVYTNIQRRVLKTKYDKGSGAWKTVTKKVKDGTAYLVFDSPEMDRLVFQTKNKEQLNTWLKNNPTQVENPTNWYVIDANYKKIGKPHSTKSIAQKLADAKNKAVGSEKFFVISVGNEPYKETENPTAKLYYIVDSYHSPVQIVAGWFTSEQAAKTALTKLKKTSGDRTLLLVSWQWQDANGFHDLTLLLGRTKDEILSNRLYKSLLTYKAKKIRNPESGLQSLLDKVYDAQTRLNSAIYLPYLSTKEQALIKANKKYFSITDAGKSVMLNKAGVAKVAITAGKGSENSAKAPKRNTTANDRGNYFVKTTKGNFYVLNCEAVFPYLMYLGFKYSELQQMGRTKELITKTAKTYDATNFSTEKWLKTNKVKFEKWLGTKLLPFSWDDKLKANYSANYSEFDFDYNKGLKDLGKMFQGKTNGQKRNVIASDLQPNTTVRIGKLKKLVINGLDGKGYEINFAGEAFASIDRRKNLWFSGKDAQITNVKVPNDGQKCLGYLTQINYVTDKAHIENGNIVEYYHKFGEVNKEKPTLWLDGDGFLIVNGGDYDVWKEGIVN